MVVVKAREAAESCCCISLYLGSPARSYKTQHLRHMALTWIILLTLFLNHVVDVRSAYRKRHHIEFCRLVSLLTNLSSTWGCHGWTSRLCYILPGLITAP
ncbi:hypothetical protein BO83DRAFT_228675 [Aspergillus eucalypticola CBS 122712]|uniref:Uncharacterized protein n=1 Tax=Aspergillus eucalypticola (strain CBS 122712 / IBT 29274) TaxID=1448314 RepID=A0A317VU90_ASPEC|nr:uncharacterized protein BO83DRAFT_228675 [Aspergillus eucalypticola CBS 122712]PWY77913.1 hypothetical protein BO83DRAFT_228675 [Aspergillus eucalypticola CBS 122712]